MKPFLPFHTGCLHAGLIACVLLSSPNAARAEDAPAGAATNAAATQPALESEWIRSFLHLQEQVYDTQLSIERSRMEAEKLAARNAEVMDARLRKIETSLEESSQLSRDTFRETMEVVKASNERVMTLALVFAGAGVLALLGTAWLQWRTVNRMAALPAPAALPPWLPAPGHGGTPGAASAHLMHAMSQLERRITGLEHPSDPTVVTVQPGSPNATSESHAIRSADPATEELGSLLREGEELLAKEEAEQAIERFDTILARQPAHAEALLRKGSALERLQRNEEAIACYDLAIAADGTLTMAYLYKGGLFNRMERFSEAMDCYEKALRIQEGRPPAT